MKIALKYGITVTAAIAAWVALKHFVLHFEGSSAQLADLFVFNFAAILGLIEGIKAKRAHNGGGLTFGDGWLTGISIAATYAILTSAYFAVLISIAGPKLMQQEGESSMVKAFLGISMGFLALGTIFSAVIAFILKRTR